VVHSRTDLAEHKLRYAHDHAHVVDLLGAIEAIRPHAIIGVSGQPGTFTTEVLHAMAALNERPIILALSNPTSKAECTAEAAYGRTGGRAIFASGSPFDAVTYEGRTLVPGQGNNAYIFPGVGLGVIVSEASRVTDEMFASAARTLASLVTDDELAAGRIYPELQRIREVSGKIAYEVAEIAFRRGLARCPRPDDLAAAVASAMYKPSYEMLE
jgi:malate dehydrogenase (oxaloacetate-decarboxylating)(NADP+)